MVPGALKDPRQRGPRFDHFARYEIADNGCWNWTGPRDHNGYGTVTIDGHTKAHRAFYTRHVGEIPEGLQLDHLCRNRGCVNPEHLEPVTLRENVLRGTGVTAVNARRTHCIHGHLLEEPNLVRNSRGWRMCKTCQNARQRQQYAKKHAV